MKLIASSAEPQLAETRAATPLTAIDETAVWLANFTSLATQRSYRTAIQEFAAFHGAGSTEDLSRLTRAHVIAWRQALEQAGAEPRTICARLAAVSSLYGHLLETLVIAANPVRGVRRPKIRLDRVEATALTAEQVRRMLDAPSTDTLQGLRDRALLHVFFYTGCRVSEPASLRVKDFGWDQGYRILDFTVKGGKRNRVAIHPDCSAALDLYLEAAGHREDRQGSLFRAVKHAREGAGLHRATLDQIFRKYAALAKLPEGASPHSARATFITEALSRDHPAEAVQQTVGHAHISTTLAYDKRDQHPRKSASFVVRY